MRVEWEKPYIYAMLTYPPPSTIQHTIHTHSWDDAIGSTVTALGFHGFIGLLVLARIEVRSRAPMSTTNPKRGKNRQQQQYPITTLYT